MYQGSAQPTLAEKRHNSWYLMNNYIVTLYSNVIVITKFATRRASKV